MGGCCGGSISLRRGGGATGSTRLSCVLPDRLLLRIDDIAERMFAKKPFLVAVSHVARALCRSGVPYTAERLVTDLAHDRRLVRDVYVPEAESAPPIAESTSTMISATIAAIYEECQVAVLDDDDDAAGAANTPPPSCSSSSAAGPPSATRRRSTEPLGGKDDDVNSSGGRSNSSNTNSANGEKNNHSNDNNRASARRGSSKSLMTVAIQSVQNASGRALRLRKAQAAVMSACEAAVQARLKQILHGCSHELLTSRIAGIEEIGAPAVKRRMSAVQRSVRAELAFRATLGSPKMTLRKSPGEEPDREGEEEEEHEPGASSAAKRGQSASSVAASISPSASSSRAAEEGSSSSSSSSILPAMDFVLDKDSQMLWSRSLRLYYDRTHRRFWSPDRKVWMTSNGRVIETEGDEEDEDSHHDPELISNDNESNNMLSPVLGKPLSASGAVIEEQQQQQPQTVGDHLSPPAARQSASQHEESEKRRREDPHRGDHDPSAYGLKPAEWAWIESNKLFWSEKESLWYDPATNKYGEPKTNRWWDAEAEQWN